MKYKVGDKVRVRKDLEVNSAYGNDGYYANFTKQMTKYRVVTISEVGSGSYSVEENAYAYTDEMFDGRYFGEVDVEKIRQFSTGAVRDTDQNKPAMETLPWDLMDRVAAHYDKGGAKYGYNNYRLGQPKSAVFGSLMRHARKYFMGDTSEDHLSAIIWNAFSLMHTDVYYPNDEELNDLQDYKKKIRGKEDET